MARRNFTTAQVVEALDEWESGVSIAVVCRRHDVSEATLYRWRSARRAGDAGVTDDEEQPHAALRRAHSEFLVAAVSLDALRVVVGEFLEPEDLQRAAQLVEVRCNMSRQRARRLLGLPLAERVSSPDAPAPHSAAASTSAAFCTKARGGVAVPQCMPSMPACSPSGAAIPSTRARGPQRPRETMHLPRRIACGS